LRWDIGLGYCLVNCGAVAAVQDQPERAVRLFATVEALFNSRGHIMQPADRALYDRHLALARTRLDASACAAAAAAGQALTLEQALEDALGPSAPAQAVASAPSTPGGELSAVRAGAGDAQAARPWIRRPSDCGGRPDPRRGHGGGRQG
jgi:hypothetical protein